MSSDPTSLRRASNSAPHYHWRMEPPAITPRRRRPFLAPVWLTMLAAVIAIGVAIVVYRSATTTTVLLLGPVEKEAGTIDDPRCPRKASSAPRGWRGCLVKPGAR